MMIIKNEILIMQSQSLPINCYTFFQNFLSCVNFEIKFTKLIWYICDIIYNRLSNCSQMEMEAWWRDVNCNDLAVCAITNSLLIIFTIKLFIIFALTYCQSMQNVYNKFFQINKFDHTTLSILSNNMLSWSSCWTKVMHQKHRNQII